MIVPTPEGFATRPIGLNFTPIMMMGAARGLDLAMLAELLPLIEPAVINPSDNLDMEGNDDDD